MFELNKTKLITNLWNRKTPNLEPEQLILISARNGWHEEPFIKRIVRISDSMGVSMIFAGAYPKAIINVRPLCATIRDYHTDVATIVIE